LEELKAFWSIPCSKEHSKYLQNLLTGIYYVCSPLGGREDSYVCV
jgi:hypothetical protein